MKQLTCGACGATQSLADGDLPAGAKEVACQACGVAIAVRPIGFGPALAAFDAEDGDGDDVLDLPAPRRASPLAGAPTGAGQPLPSLGLELDALQELPTVNEAPASNKTAFGIATGPAPRDMGDLPAPKTAKTGLSALAGLGDLPAPKGPAAASGPFGDLPAPKGPVGSGGPFGDLPAPKGPVGSGGPFGDLPAPKGPVGGAFGDLPAPKGPVGGAFGNLPTPKGPVGGGGIADLPAPKGPAGAFADLPAPKAPAAAPPLNLGHAALDMLDLPSPAAPAANSLTPKLEQGLTAKPSDLFADLPLPSPAAPPKVASGASLDLLGDLPKPISTHAPSSGGGKALDLDDLDLEQPSTPAATAGGKAEPLAPPPIAKPAAGAAVPNLDLGDFGGLDLPSSSASSSSQPSQRAAAAQSVSDAMASNAAAAASGASGASVTEGRNKTEVDFGTSTDDLDLSLGSDKQAAPAFGMPSSSTKSSAPAANPDGPATKIDISSKKSKGELTKRAKLIAVGVGVAVLLVISGGIYGYLKWSAAKELETKIANLLVDARTELSRGNTGHWDKAVTIANEVLALQPNNSDALGIAAQGLLAGYLDEGVDGARRLGQVKNLIAKMGTAKGNDVEMAQALKLLALDTGQGERALQRLETVVAADPGNKQVALYQGWAYLSARKWKAAQVAFERSLAAAPERQIPELIGRAEAKAMLGDREGARADYAKVLEKDKDHIGAQVGLAAAMPPSDYARRESDLVALLARPDIEKADARAVLKAWGLAADEALRAGRLEVAADRYRKALAISGDDFAATLGLAKLALRQDRVDEAERQVLRALDRDKADIAARMLHVEVLIAKGNPNEARGVMDNLIADANATTNASIKSRVLVLRGEMLEAEGGKPDDVIALYQEAVATAETGDYGPPVAAANGLGRLAAKADAEKQPELAKQYRAKAEEFLTAISSLANNDPATALTLGVAYTTTGAPARGEEWLRKALASRPGDIETNFQLAVALSRQGKRQEAINVFAKTFAMDGSRLDVGLQYALELEAAARDGEAGDLYAKLVSSRDVTLDIRARAGRFWARQGDIDKAKEQGDQILEVAPEYPAGLFLKAEGLLKAGKLDEARRFFTRASDEDGEAQYFDGLGRACEALGADGDLRYKDEAIRAYGKASEIDPKMFNSLSGLGRLHLERVAFEKALVAYTAAETLLPSDPGVLFGKGAALQGLRRYQDALAALTKAVAITPTADAYYKIAQVNRDLERTAASASALSSATRMGIEQETKTGKKVEWLSEAMWMSGFLENQLGNDASACRAWKLFIARNPTEKARVTEATRTMMGFRGCL
ncbi:MAG: tetratricopeptide repeat protein [Myxococcales bacterium]|nr:tetratricopeptide repeat protein [Myxococcales bacterium]